MVYGTYNARGYTVHHNDDKVYRAGNYPGDSQQYVRIGLSVDIIRAFCRQTTREIADEFSDIYTGITYEPISENN